MSRFRSRSSAKRQIRVPFAAYIILSCLSLLCSYWWLLRPFMAQQALHWTQIWVQNELAGCVSAELADSQERDWYVTRDEAGGQDITYLDLAQVTRFGQKVAAKVDDQMEELSAAPVRIPVGTLLRLPIWNGPRLAVPVRILLVHSVHTQVSVTSTPAGWNGSTHTVHLTMTAHVHVLTPFLNQTLVVRESTPIAYFLVSHP